MSKWTDGELEFLDTLDELLEEYELGEEALKAAEGKMFESRTSVTSIWRDDDAGPVTDQELLNFSFGILGFEGVTKDRVISALNGAEEELGDMDGTSEFKDLIEEYESQYDGSPEVTKDPGE